jgi:hypothetical protein
MKNNCFTKIIYSAFILLVFIPLGTAFAEEGIRTPVSSQEKSQFPYNITYAWNINKEGSSKMRCTGTIIKDNWYYQLLIVSQGKMEVTEVGIPQNLKQTVPHTIF